MKKYKIIMLTIAIMTFFMTTNASALYYYLPYNHAYYQRSQHTYSYNYKGTNHPGNAPGLYTLITDEKLVNEKSVWNFFEHYKFPWTPEDSTYSIAYCSDMPITVLATVPYNRIPFRSTSLYKEEIKENLQGILTHSYPFISEDKMIQQLLKEGVLVYKQTSKGGFITSKENAEPSRSVNSDELVSAAQLAIYHFTNSDEVDKIYDRTYYLERYTVTRRAGVWSNIYQNGYYEEVENNIMAIYNYLIKQKEQLNKLVSISKVVAVDNKQLNITLENLGPKNNNLTFILKEDDKTVQTTSIKDAKQQNNTYIIPLDKNVDVSKLKVNLTGSVYYNNEPYIYEAVDGKESSQTLITLASTDVPIETLYNKRIIMEISQNPDTNQKFTLILISIIGFALIGIIGCFLNLKKQH